MVHHGQAQRLVGPDAVDERRPLARAPPDPRRRVGQVENQRQDPSLIVLAQPTIEPVDHDVVRVHRHDVPGAGLDGHPREPTVVGAEIEDQSRIAAPGYRGDDEGLLRREVAFGVVGSVAVSRPRGVLGGPRQLVDGPSKVAELRVDELGAESGRLQLRPDVALLVGVGVSPFRPRVELDVGEHALLEPAGAADDGRRGRRRDAVHTRAQERAEGHVAQRLDVERVEVQLAELAVTGPRFALTDPFERTDVDEHRLGPRELHVVRRRVLGDHPLGERLTGEVELEPGGVTEHLERPLVRVRQHRDPRVAQHRRPPVRQVGWFREDLGGDDVAPFQCGSEESSRGDGVEVGECLRGQPAQHAAGSDVDPRQRVAERPRIGLSVGRGDRRLSRRHRRAAGRERRPPRPVLLREDPREPVPVHLEEHAEAGGSASEGGGDHAAGAGIEIAQHGL